MLSNPFQNLRCTLILQLINQSHASRLSQLITNTLADTDEPRAIGVFAASLLSNRHCNWMAWELQEEWKPCTTSLLVRIQSSREEHAYTYYSNCPSVLHCCSYIERVLYTFSPRHVHLWVFWRPRTDLPTCGHAHDWYLIRSEICQFKETETETNSCQVSWTFPIFAVLKWWTCLRTLSMFCNALFCTWGKI